jgi:predicted transcriptional regulator
VEALPLELQRNYTLIRQLDENAEEMMAQVATEAKDLSSTMKQLSKEERRSRLERISLLLNETLKKGEEKLALAKSTYDTVSYPKVSNSYRLMVG